MIYDHDFKRLEAKRRLDEELKRFLERGGKIEKVSVLSVDPVLPIAPMNRKQRMKYNRIKNATEAEARAKNKREDNREVDSQLPTGQGNLRI